MNQEPLFEETVPNNSPEAPVTPEIPKAPEVPKVPAAPEAGEVSEASEVPEALKASEAPEAPVGLEAPEKDGVPPQKPQTEPEAPRPITKEELHRQRVMQVTEAAKDRSLYETYECRASDADPNLLLFRASKRGIGHERKKMPCQDYCLTASGSGCSILADADGVSSCAHSEIGAKLACEAVVKTVLSTAGSSQSEEQLVKRLCSVSFRERLVSNWVSEVLKLISEYETPPKDELEELRKYGSTIMFAVITPNWYITGNLGDGQVIVFNDKFGIKLRVHAPKESSRVRCLVNERCAREDFLVYAYPRILFNGVLLSTDGMYESFDRGRHFFNYASQMKERFLSVPEPEPLQPFCYLEEGEPFKDFSVQRTMDDCSIALAVDRKPVDGAAYAIHRTAASLTDDMLAVRYGGGCMTWYAIKQGETVELVSAPEPVWSAAEKLEHAVVEEPSSIWNESGRRYAFYPVAKDETLESLYSNGLLRRHGADPGNEERLLNVCRLVMALQRELVSTGHTLNAAALFLVRYDGNQLTLRREAVSPLEDPSRTAMPEPVAAIFLNLLGVLEAEGHHLPLTGSGYIDRSDRMDRFDGCGEGPMFQLFREKKEYSLKNVGDAAWLLENGQTVAPGDLVVLTDGLTFSLAAPGGPVTYRFTKKESL